MMRNEEGQFAADLTVDERIAAAKAELAKLEKEKADAAQKEKVDRAAIKKADAGKVETAYKARCEARRAAAKLIDDAEKVFQDALDEFKKKYPEGYHMTLKDGDDQLTVSYNRFLEDPFAFFKDLFW